MRKVIEVAGHRKSSPGLPVGERADVNSSPDRQSILGPRLEGVPTALESALQVGDERAHDEGLKGGEMGRHGTQQLPFLDRQGVEDIAVVRGDQVPELLDLAWVDVEGEIGGSFVGRPSRFRDLVEQTVPGSNVVGGLRTVCAARVKFRFGVGLGGTTRRCLKGYSVFAGDAEYISFVERYNDSRAFAVASTGERISSVDIAGSGRNAIAPRCDFRQDIEDESGAVPAADYGKSDTVAPSGRLQSAIGGGHCSDSEVVSSQSLSSINHPASSSNSTTSGLCPRPAPVNRTQ